MNCTRGESYLPFIGFALLLTVQCCQEASAGPDTQQLEVLSSKFQMRMERQETLKALAVAQEMTKTAPQSALAWETLATAFLTPGEAFDRELGITALDRALLLMAGDQKDNQRIELLSKFCTSPVPRNSTPGTIPIAAHDENTFKMLSEELLVQRERGEMNKFLETIKKMETVAPNHPAVWIAYGEVYGHEGSNFNTDKAIEALRKYIAVLPGEENREKRMSARRLIAELEAGNPTGTYDSLYNPLTNIGKTVNKMIETWSFPMG